MKWDGVRTVAYLAGGRVQLLSRKGRDDTAAYFDVVDDLAAIDAETAVLDGEVVVADPSGRPDFGLLQNRINLTRPADIERAARPGPAQLMLFDILELNGQSLIKKPYEERRGAPRGAGPAGARARGSRCRRSSTATSMRRCETSKALRLEGVVAKRRDSIYQPGRRSQTWLKIKQPPDAGGGHRRLAARTGPPRRRRRLAADGRPDPGRAALRRPGRLRLQRPPARRDPGAAGAAGPQDQPADRRTARGRPRRALGDARRWSARSPTANSPARAACGTRSGAGCAPTSPQPTSSGNSRPSAERI